MPVWPATTEIGWLRLIRPVACAALVAESSVRSESTWAVVVIAVPLCAQTYATPPRRSEAIPTHALPVARPAARSLASNSSVSGFPVRRLLAV